MLQCGAAAACVGFTQRGATSCWLYAHVSGRFLHKSGSSVSWHPNPKHLIGISNLKTDDTSAEEQAAAMKPDVLRATKNVSERATVEEPSDTDELDKFIQGKMASVHMPSVSALVQRNSTLLWSHAYGFANAFSSPPRNASVTGTPYTMASVSKTVMATTLMALFDQGLFALDDDINTYLKDSAKAGFELRNPRHPLAAITFRNLLTHTSSINDRCWADASDTLFYTRGRNNPWSVHDMLFAYLSTNGKYYNASLCFHEEAPGGLYDYSNIGANVLGYMVEVLVGSNSFGRFSVANVLKPLGMQPEKNNWLLNPPLDLSAIALPSSWVEEESRLEPYCLYGCCDYPDSGLRVTAAGLARHQAMFMQYGELDGVRLLKESTVREMRRKQTLSSGKEIDGGQGQRRPLQRLLLFHSYSYFLDLSCHICGVRRSGLDLVLRGVGQPKRRRGARAAGSPRL